MNTVKDWAGIVSAAITDDFSVDELRELAGAILGDPVEFALEFAFYVFADADMGEGTI